MDNAPYRYSLHRNNPFCEGQQIGIYDAYSSSTHTVTETANCISNLGYILFSIFSFQSVFVGDFMLRLCSAILFWTGISSAAYHATFFYAFGYLDGASLHLLIILLAGSLWQDILMVTWAGKNKVIMWFFSVGAMGWFLFVSLMKDLEDEWTPNDTVLFGVSIASILSALIYLFISHNVYNFRCLIIVTVASFLFAFIVRVIDVSACTQVSVWFFLHSWWHLLSAYSCAGLITILVYIRSEMFGYTAQIEWWARFYPICILSCCPQSPPPASPGAPSILIRNPQKIEVLVLP